MFTVVSITTIGLVILLATISTANSAPLGAPSNANSTAENQQPPQTNCTSVVEIPQIECRALEELYRSTNGQSWISNTNWLSVTQGISPCDWYGVTCNGGHITELRLEKNGLRGQLPQQLGNLSHLAVLHLQNNALNKRVPRLLCTLQDTVTDADFSYNALYSPRRRVNTCMDQMDPDWRTTQTTAPTGVKVTQVSTTSIEISWKPIVYTDDGGGYRVVYRTEPGGPITIHGDTTDKLASGYVLDGLEPGQTYYIYVRSFTPAHDEQRNSMASDTRVLPVVTLADGQRVLIVAYFAADNNLAPQIPVIINKFRLGTVLNPNTTVLFLADSRGEGNSRVVEIANGVVTKTNIVAEQWGVNELDTADPSILSSYLQYARTNYPAERIVVTLLGHGIALAPEVEWATEETVIASMNRNSNDIPPLPDEWDETPSDITDRGYMSTTDMGQALMDATDNGANPFDLVFFDQCFQGNLEALYEVHSAADVFVASPNYGWLVAAYAQYLAQFAPTSTPEQMAQGIINRYKTTLNNNHPNAIFWVRGDDIPKIAQAVSDLGNALNTALQSDERAAIGQSANDAQFVDTAQCGQQSFVLAPPDELMGAETFAKNLKQNFAANDPYGVNVAADALLTELANIESQSITGSPWIAPEQEWNYDDTITILAPLNPATSPASAWRSTIYREDAPFAANWTIDESQQVSVTKSLAFVKDYEWDEFLHQWYGERSPTVGEWCHYIPTEQVVVEDAEPLSLTVAISGTNGMQLNWTPTDHADASEYRLFGQGPYDAGPIVYASTSISETAFAAMDLAEGTYNFSVVAFSDLDEAAVGQSEIVSATVEGRTFGEGIDLFLPVILRE